MKVVDSDAQFAVEGRPSLGLKLQRTLFWATVTDDAVKKVMSLHGWRHALSADPAYAPSPQQLDALKHHGPVDGWGNQLEIGPERIEEFAASIAPDARRIGQAENETEARHLTQPYAIGNFTAQGLGDMFEALKNRVATGHLNATAEVYNGRPETYDTNGFPVDSFTLGVAMDDNSNPPHYPLRDLIVKMRVAGIPTGGVCIWGIGDSKFTDDDWAVLATL